MTARVVRTDSERRERNRAKTAAWRSANPERSRVIDVRFGTRSMERYRSDPEYRARKADIRRASVHGITAAEYDALLAAQGGACAICGRPETRRSNGTEVKRLAVDHDHATEAVRGLLCHDCNVALGFFGDDIERIQRAIDYIREASATP